MTRWGGSVAWCPDCVCQRCQWIVVNRRVHIQPILPRYIHGDWPSLTNYSERVICFRGTQTVSTAACVRCLTMSHEPQPSDISRCPHGPVVTKCFLIFTCPGCRTCLSLSPAIYWQSPQLNSGQDPITKDGGWSAPNDPVLVKGCDEWWMMICCFYQKNCSITCV